MPLFHVSVKHGRNIEDARARLATAVAEVRQRFGPMVQRVEWSDDRGAVKLSAGGVVLDMRIDAEEVHVSGDVPMLAALFGGSFESSVKQIVQKTFTKG